MRHIIRLNASPLENFHMVSTLKSWHYVFTKTLFLFQRNFKKEAKKRAICIICFRKETRDEEITTGHSIYIGTVSSYPKDLYQVHIGNIDVICATVADNSYRF